jgi:topoisomerase-4 subunit A
MAMSNHPEHYVGELDLDDVSAAEIVEVLPLAASGKNAARVFSALPPPPEGDVVPLAQYAERAYLEYAVSVVKGRALPDVCDGQKPVQRRILYAMREMGLSAVSRHVKSARVVGEVLGKFHPHGDSSAYEAMVRLAQSFSLRYPLVDGQGNFGSRDGDNAAAMRYTESRLTPIAELLLSEINMGTVDFEPNYDGAFIEPALLPARLPMVLLNGASGIAVGMATEIPSHNLREVGAAAAAVVRNPDLTADELLAHVLGPDLPGGGQIISSAAEIRECYRTGRGSLKMRARWNIEELARGQWQVVIYELPHGVSTKKILEEIEDLTNPKVRANKKSLSPDQVQNKALMLSMLDKVADESDKDQAIRLVLEPKSSRLAVADMMAVLLAHTSLECSLSLNMVMISLDGRPQQKPLATILREWGQFRVATVFRRVTHRLSQVNERIHILEGRMIVYLNVDEVIKLIRESDEPKAALMARFSLSERQAEDILEIRLRQLARLEGIKIERELNALKDERTKLEKLLASDKALRTLVANEIDADVKTFGDERRTLIEAASRTVLSVAVVDEAVTVIVSNKHWVRTRLGHGQDLSTLAFKDGDGLWASFECRSTDSCIVMCSNGRVCSVPVSALPGGRGDGVPLTTLIELAAGARIVQVLCGNSSQAVLWATTAGYGFSCTLGDMLGRNKAGKQFISVEKEAILPPVLFTPSETARVCASSKQGRLLVFSLLELKALSGGGKGVIVLGLSEGDELAAMTVIHQGSLQVTVNAGTREQVIKFSHEALQVYVGKRARGGKAVSVKPNLCVIAMSAGN